MTTTFRYIVVVICTLVKASTLALGDDASTNVGSGAVEMTLIGPDLRPLAGREVNFSEDTSHGFDRPVVWLSKTDDGGRVRFDKPAGTHQFHFLVPGVGFGGTGQFVVSGDGSVARVPIPPLAQVGTVQGAVDPAFLGPETKIKLQVLGRQEWSSSVDATGHFSFSDVLPCDYYLTASAGEMHSDQVPFTLLPGEQLNGIKMHVAQPNPAEGKLLKEINRGRGGGPHPQAVWATGTVRDLAGQPLAGAEVFALVTYDGGLRQAEKLVKILTAADGTYSISGDGDLQGFNGCLLVHANGHPPVFAQFDSPKLDSDDKPLPAKPADFTLADGGGSLTIRALRDGRPATDIAVSIQLAGCPHLFTASSISMARGPERAQIASILQPTVLTGSDGLARFDLLIPGNYSVLARATESGEKLSTEPFSRFGFGEDKTPRGSANAIAVGLGKSRSFDLAVYPQPNRNSIRLLRPDGLPVSGNISSQYGQGSEISWSSFDDFKDGLTSHFYQSAGFWTVRYAFGDKPLQWTPVEGPAYRAAATVAVSPAITDDSPVELKAAWCDGATVILHVLDAEGKPARATVVVPGFELPEMAGTTNSQGVVRFDGLPQGDQRFDVYTNDDTAGYLTSLPGSPLPEERRLRGRKVYRQLRLSVVGGEVREVTCRPVPVTYIRGFVHPEAGRTPADYYVASFYTDLVPTHMSDWYDKRSGEYVYGPFANGEAYFQVGSYAGNSEAKVKTIVSGSEISHIDLSPKPVDPKAAPDDVQIGMGGITMRGAMSRATNGSVWMPGGQMPAFGAIVETFVPDVWQPIAHGTTDAKGRVRGGGDWYTNDAPTPPPTGSPVGPVAVAYLPGVTGGVIVPLDGPGEQNARFVLPPPASVVGQVTVDGRPFEFRNAYIRVIGAHIGDGKLNSALSVSTTASADGTFELAGISPGLCKIQAAIDDVWVSNVVSLSLPGALPPTVKLNVSSPGTTMMLRLKNPKGKPIVATNVHVDRPEGPLAEMLIPESYPVDGVGYVTLNGLSAGLCRVTVNNHEQTFQVKPRSTSGPTTVEITVPYP